MIHIPPFCFSGQFPLVSGEVHDGAVKRLLISDAGVLSALLIVADGVGVPLPVVVLLSVLAWVVLSKV